MIRIFLADDHKILRQGIRSLLEAEADIQVVGETADGIEAVREVGRLRPDVLLADITMPGLSGIQVTLEARSTCPETCVVILSMHTEEEYVRQALEAGAKGYVVKESGVEHLIRAIREVVAGRCYLSPPLELDPKAYLGRRNGGHTPDQPVS